MKHLVLVGGGHAHLTALLRLSDYVARGHRVTLISTSEYQYYSGMGPGMLSGLYRPQQVRFHLKPLVENREGSFIEDTVVRVEPGARTLLLRSGEEVTYDVASFNTGSTVASGSLLASQAENVFAVKPIINLLKARERILDMVTSGGRIHLVVVGGGPAGVELSANAWRLLRDAGGEADITLVTGSGLLPGVPERAGKLARSSLTARGIHILQDVAVLRLQAGRAELEDGRSIPYDLALVATGVRPSSLFGDSGMPTGRDGGLLVNRYLQSVAHPDIFGGGDCVSLEGAELRRVGVYAVRQNPILYHNLMAALEDRELRPFRPGGAFLLILNMGDGRGIFWKKGLVLDGRAAFVFKDFLDRRFMRRFQVSGELDEPAGDPG